MGLGVGDPAFRFIPQAVSTVTSSPLFSHPFGQGLEMCGPHRRFAPLLPRTLRRIPQAVGTVTSLPLFSLPFSQGLEMCGPHRRFTPLLAPFVAYRKR